jgi:para-aminobenzoate synthetase component I
LNLTKHAQHNYTAEQLLYKLTALCQNTPTACLYVSNVNSAPFDFMLAYNSTATCIANTHVLEAMSKFQYENKNYVMGHISYDVKNELEQLSSQNYDYQAFDALHLFVPELLITIKNNNITYTYSNETILSNVTAQLFNEQLTITTINTSACKLVATTSKQDYIANVNTIKQHIQRGDIYITNYCINYVSEDTVINPYQKFIALNAVSSAPFACLYKYNGKYVLSASPERYIQRIANKVITMPIKGTRKRGKNTTEDMAITLELANNAKEQNENVMIVDLVRNDLSHVALPNTINVDALFKVHTFKTVHQLISTVACTVADNETTANIIKATFPMGSMTGAPKISAMQLMEKYENFKRGIYSGSIGYIKPNNDFDFNVVIRSIIYNSITKTVSVPVGSAITNKCDANDEYNECLLKAKVLLDLMQ